MKRKIIISGASGMIGNEILMLALSSSEIETVVSLVRKPSNLQHDKLKQVVVDDFSDFTNHQNDFQNIDAAYFCIGAYTGQVKDDLFKKITVDYAVAFARQVREQSPDAKLCLLSGAGADRTEKSRTAFARYKGMAENQITNLGIEFYSFRPGYIYPVTPRKEPSIMYSLMRTIYPIIKLFGSGASIPSTNLAKAMFLIGLNGYDTEVLENKAIVDYANSNQ